MSVTYSIDYSDLDNDIIRCLNTLYSTRAGSQPMRRDFGIDYEGVLGAPLEVAKNKLALEIIEKTEVYEPRVTVTSVDFDVDVNNGRLVPIIHVKKAGETDE